MGKRMHPIQIAYSYVETLRNSIIIILYLFILNWNNPSLLFKYGRWAFALFLVVRFITIIVSWSKTTYELKDQTAHMYRGLFRKKHSSVPLERVQNIQRNTPFYFKVFKVTSLSLETGISEDGAAMRFEAVKIDEADRIEQYLADYRKQVDMLETDEGQLEKTSDEQFDDIDSDQNMIEKRTVHFNPTRKEVLKASFLSLSFLAIIPIIMTAYFKAEDVINVEEKMQGFVTFLMNSWLIMVVAIIIVISIAVIFGIVHAYLRYGKYEIASDDERIYIRRGVLNERSLSIRKDRVQAIQINQPVLKKLLGIAEVRLISASSGLGDTEEISSLYPFLPIDRAYSMLEEILPIFQIKDEMNKLPKKSLYIKMLRLPWLFLFATAFVIWFKPGWWYGLPVIFIVTYLMRFFQYRNTRYVMDGSYVQFKFGGLSSTTFLTTRQKVIEVGVERSLLQKKFGLATMHTYNRTTLYHLEELADIPYETSQKFLDWYAGRLEEIEIERQ